MTSRACLLLLVSAVACAAGSPPAASTPPPAVSEPSPGEPGAAPGSPGPSEPPDATEPSEPGFPGSKWAPRDMGVSVPEAWQTCSAATDCTLVVTTCCDQCNGGKAVAVNGAHAKEVAAKYPQSCGGVACTERGCFTRAACQRGRCTMEWLSASP